MQPTSLPTYHELHVALNQTALKLHASQVHGLVCGILCGHPSHTSAWGELVTGGGEEKSTTTHELLQALYDATAKQLDEMLFELQLLLPADSEPLPLRAEALTLWCQGFLTGLKLAKIKISGREASDTTEAINDMIEIAKMNYEDVVDSEEDEVAYVELVEFVRMAAILIYQDSHDEHSANNEDDISPHLH